jgi:hypothetical protein
VNSVRRTFDIHRTDVCECAHFSYCIGLRKLRVLCYIVACQRFLVLCRSSFHRTRKRRRWVIRLPAAKNGSEEGPANLTVARIFAKDMMSLAVFLDRHWFVVAGCLTMRVLNILPDAISHGFEGSTALTFPCPCVHGFQHNLLLPLAHS